MHHPNTYSLLPTFLLISPPTTALLSLSLSLSHTHNIPHVPVHHVKLASTHSTTHSSPYPTCLFKENSLDPFTPTFPSFLLYFSCLRPSPRSVVFLSPVPASSFSVHSFCSTYLPCNGGTRSVLTCSLLVLSLSFSSPLIRSSL